MRILKNKIPMIACYLKFQTAMVERLVWPYSYEKDGLVRWRALILFSILFGGIILGAFAFAGAVFAIIDKGEWGLGISDLSGLVIGFVLLSAPRIKFEIRALVTCFLFYFVGVIVIISVGPQIGGPAWLFAFAVLAGVLMGNSAAFGAILMNAVFLSAVCMLMLNGKHEHHLPFFNTPKEMIAAVGNFLAVNAITAISVSAIFKGIVQIYKEKEEIATRLEKEKLQLIKTKLSLETEIQDRKKTEKALQESEALFKLITDHTSALVSIHDSDTHYIFASPSHERLGFKPEELIGRSGFTMVIEEDIEPLQGHLDNAKNGNISHALLNYRLKDKKGQIHDFRGLFDPVFKQDGSIERIICVGEDETELKQAQEESMKALAAVAEAKKLSLIGQIAGKMAHDFNNILGIIMGISELSIVDCNDEEIKRNLELILNQTLRGKNLTKNLVAFAKSQEPKQEFFKINEKIDLVIDLMKKDLENIGLIIDHGSDIPDLLADPGMIEHALVNFLQNSIHATGKTMHPRIIIRTYCLDNRICLEIEDNGCGIPKEHLKDIYEPSFTLKGSKDIAGAYEFGIKGTGYGMANAKKYIEQHNGEIFVESVVNFGTKFTIHLPVIEKELSAEEKIKIQKGITHYEKSILLVEDEQAISDVQYRILTQNPCRHKVDIASNGQVAMDLFSRNQYDLISLDYVLPGKINGMDVYNYIREIDKTIPILFVSGNIEFLESIISMKHQDKNLEHQSKPCLNKEYIANINKLLNLHFSAEQY